MPRKLISGPDYPTEREALSNNARTALRWVEEAIADDPDHRIARFQYPSGIVVDYSADDLAVSYLVLKNGEVVLLEVMVPPRS